MEYPKIHISKAKCLHDVPVKTGYGGQTVHVIVLQDLSNNKTYTWRTSCVPNNMEIGQVYDLTGRIDKTDNSIKYASCTICNESEQKKVIDVFDLIYNTTN